MRDIEVDDDPQFQRKTEVVQKVGWVFIAIFLIAAVVGLLGQSRFSTREIANDGLSVEYDAYVRRGTESELKVVAHPRSGSKDVVIWMSREYVDGITFEKIFPEPEKTESSDDGVRFFFTAPPNAKSVEIVFTIVAPKPGRFRAEVSDLSADLRRNPVEFTQLSYF